MDSAKTTTATPAGSAEPDPDPRPRDDTPARPWLVVAPRDPNLTRNKALVAQSAAALSQSALAVLETHPETILFYGPDGRLAEIEHREGRAYVRYVSDPDMPRRQPERQPVPFVPAPDMLPPLPDTLGYRLLAAPRRPWRRRKAAQPLENREAALSNRGE
jgi:hypothetical protein